MEEIADRAGACAERFWRRPQSRSCPFQQALIWIGRGSNSIQLPAWFQEFSGLFGRGPRWKLRASCSRPVSGGQSAPRPVRLRPITNVCISVVPSGLAWLWRCGSAVPPGIPWWSRYRRGSAPHYWISTAIPVAYHFAIEVWVSQRTPSPRSCDPRWQRSRAVSSWVAMSARFARQSASGV